MPKMTQKYRTALENARNLSIEDSDRDTLYEALEENGYFWNAEAKEWENCGGQEPDDPTPYLLVRVWADIDEVETHAARIIRLFQENGYILPEKSKVYPCRPPKQLEGRIYLRFLPAN